MAQCFKTLLLLLGPTGVGKTELSLRVAEHFGCPIVNCDSRQIFRSIPIGTAAPTAEEQARVKHYFIATRELEEDYNAGQFERDAIALLDDLFKSHAVCHGLDDLPAVPPDIRTQVQQGYEEKGLNWLQTEVQRLDPAYWEEVDRQNPARLMHCVELCLTTGKAYSSLRTNTRRERPFRIIKIGLERPRALLYARIDERVKQMIAEGLVEEAKAVYPKRALNSLQTVGYRELFAYFDGEYDLDRAIELIQLTWFRRDKEIVWLNAEEDYEKNIASIDDLLRRDGV